MLKALLAFVFAAHGVAHLVGFLGSWRLASFAEMPYRTTILSGRIDLGESGIRAMGAGWLALAVACGVVALGFAIDARWAVRLAAGVLLASSLFCILGWPEARIGLFVNLGLAVVLATSTVVTSRRAWSSATDELVAAVHKAPTAQPAFDAGALDALPPPVARFFRHVLPDAQAPILSAQIEQEAEFYVTSGTPGWRPLTATQHFSVRPPGFVWDARIRMAPMVSVWVRDAYAGGTGSMRADVLGVYPMVRASRSPELDAGALHRYLAELIWLPTALLPGAGVEWRPKDDRSAVASIEDHGTRVELEFRFTDAGDVEEIFAAGRFRESDGRFEPTPWVVRCWDYQERMRIRIPLQAEVRWLLADGPQPYWRGRITQVLYTFSR
jgi:hypothetical protein